MSHEVLVLSDGESFIVTETIYSEWMRHQETYPGTLEDGREGQIELTVDIAGVRFSATPGRMTEGDTGQLSIGDGFCGITILSVEGTADGSLQVNARARKHVSWKSVE
jgi:hypothetical protein